MDFCQVAIFVLSIAAGMLVTFKQDDIRRWGYVVGLASEPFWFWSAYDAGQWGIFGVCVMWTIVWAVGVWNHFK